MCRDIERITHRELFARFAQGQGFQGYIADYYTRSYELSEKGYRINANTKSEFVRQFYEGEEILRTDNLHMGRNSIRYWMIKEDRR
jgi:hypothetical protein